jgi:peptide/nickel transport system substrate-binding protein
MRRSKQRMIFIVTATCLGMLAAACGNGSSSSSSSTSTTAASGAIANQRYAANSSGTPVRGGTLTMLGTGDVDYMDPNVSYYAVGYLGLRIWSRSLYTYPAIQGQTTTPVPDLATANPTITNGGLTYSVTIRQGAMWNTSPPRQVTAADALLGVKRTCNPTQPFGGQPDFTNLIAGYAAFCNGFTNVSSTDPAAQKAYIDANKISGVTVDPHNAQTIIFQLTQQVSYFTDILGLNAFDPAPVEYLNYLPASNDLAQHTISDGPYQVQTYDPAKSIDFVRNPVWKASTDTIRKAYVNQINVNETGTQASIQQQILTNTPQADMEWDSYVPTNDIPSLLAANDQRLGLESEFSTNPYVVFNAQSPNSGGALGKLAVRQALEYGLNRTNLVQDGGGPKVSPPLTQVLPPGITGSAPSYSQYNYDPAKAKQLLASAGYSSGLTLKFLYRPASLLSSNMFQTIQSDLGKIGITVVGVGVPNADFYTKYLEKPSQATSGVWDVSLAGWSPDWYGNAAASFFPPLFDGRILPPTSSNFGLFSDPTLNPIIDAALKAPTEAAAAALWHQADIETMKNAAIFPITAPNQPEIHGSQVHNAIYMAIYEQSDPTNVWLSK